MWKISLILGVLAIAVAAGLFTAFLYYLVVCGKKFIKIVESWDDEMSSCVKSKFNHERYRYTESHPDKVWTCNDCGEIF